MGPAEGKPFFAGKQSPGPGRILSALLACASLAWIFACLWYPLTDTDIWWQLAAAKWMLAHRAFLRVDPFCQASLGVPWTDLHWGFQLLCHAAWEWGGARALVAGKCLAVAGALLAALRPHLDRRTWPWLLPMAAFGLYHARYFLDVRPLALTLFGLASQYSAVMAYLRGSMRRPWLILIPVQIALANIQGLYPLGTILMGCLLAGEYAARAWPRDGSRPGRFPAIRLASAFPGAETVPLLPLVISVLAMGLSGFATPYGLDGFLLPFSLFGRISPQASNVFSREIAENLPFADLLSRDPGAALPFLALGVFTLLTFQRAAARTSAGHLLIFLAFAGLGLMAQRNLPLALLAALMAAGRNLQVSQGPARARVEPGPDHRPAEPARGTRDGGRGAVLAGWAALACVVAAYAPRIGAAWSYELPGSLVTPFRIPIGAVDVLEAHPIPGHLFNELRFGGYISYRLYPKLAFVDGRMILRSAGFYRGFLAVVDQPEGFAAYADANGFTHAMLPIAEDRRFLPLAAHLIRIGWGLVYCDGAAALLIAPQTQRSVPALAAMRLDSLSASHPLPQALQTRFAGNPRLLALSQGNAQMLLETAGKTRAAADLVTLGNNRGKILSIP